MTGNNGSTVNHDERVAKIMRLHGEGYGARAIADELGMKLSGLRKWLRVHEHRDVLEAIALVRFTDRDRRRENAARAAAAAARIRTGSMTTVEVYTVAEAARLVGMGESPWSVSRQIGKAPATVEKYAGDVGGLLHEIDQDELDELGLTVEVCRSLQRVFAAEHEAQLAFRREQRRQTALYSRSA